jgi:hypothetical protein
LLLVLAYRTRDDNDNPIAQDKDTPRRGMHRRQNGLSPELKLINPVTEEEVEVDSLTVSRFETLSAADYHLGTLYVPHPQTMTPAQRSALEAIGGGIWDVGAGAARIFSSGASVMNMPFISESKTPPRAPSLSSASAGNVSSSTTAKRLPQINPNAATAGLKVFIHSPYDCVLAIKRDLSDHFQWELEHENFKDAWELLEDHPEIISTSTQLPVAESSPASTPLKKQGSLHEFFADDSASQTTISATNRRSMGTAACQCRGLEASRKGGWTCFGHIRTMGTLGLEVCPDEPLQRDLSLYTQATYAASAPVHGLRGCARTLHYP